jgi:predicted amidohydrolase
MRVSSIQLEIKDQPKESALQRVLTLLDETRGSDLVLLPELWPCGFLAYERYARDSESIAGPTVQALQAKARELRIHLLTGSFIERDGQALHNTTLLLDPNGDVLGRYRKIHLFGYQSEERRLLQPGADVTVVATPWGQAGLATCYDLRFPEMFRRMVDRGAEFFLVASAWPPVRLEAWTLFNRARAHENLAWLFSCNCAGAQAGQRYAGHSLFVDPRGQIVAEGGDGESIISAEVDIQLAAAVRREFPALEDRVFKST